MGAYLKPNAARLTHLGVGGTVGTVPARLLRSLVVLSLVVAAGALPVASVRPKPHAVFRTMTVRPNATLRAPAEFRMVGVSWPRGQAAPKSVSIRTSRDGRGFSRWHRLEIAPDEGPDRRSSEAQRTATNPLWIGHARFAQVKWSGHLSRDAKVDMVDPGPDPVAPASAAMASSAQPSIISRAEWGADESIRRKAPSYAEPMKLTVIHHTATPDSYSASDSAAIVRSIYTYHVQTNGWDDIGYNFLVSRYGQIFEGRYGGITRTVIGAHALGFNRNSVGISVIGTFSVSKPPEVAMQALKRLVAWRMDVGHVDPRAGVTYTSGGSEKWPEGKKVSLKTISGHRDTGSTDCPGGAIYNSLAWLRGAAYADGLPKLFNVRLTRSVVTPNGDGIDDGVRLLGTFSSSMSWTVRVLNHAGTAVYSRSGTGTGLDIPWWAKSTTGAVVPQDDYTVRVTASNSQGTIRTTDLPLDVWRYPNGTFFIAQPSATTWILDKGKLRHPINYQARGTRYLVEEAVIVPDSFSSHYPTARKIGFRNGTLVSADGKTYLISDNYRRPISAATLAALGYDSGAIIKTTADMLKANPLGDVVKTAGGHPNGTAVSSDMMGEALMVKGIARPFISSNVRISYLIHDDEVVSDDQAVTAGTASSPLRFRDGTIIQVSGQTTIYVIANGQRHAIGSYAFDKMGYDAKNIRTVTPAELALQPEGDSL